MGRHHLGALGRRPTWALAGVVDPLAPLDRVDPAVPQGSDLAGMLQDLRPQGAIVAVPPSAHEAVARACLDAGCHVLLEKPLCPTHARAKALAPSFQEAGRVLFGGHSERFHPVFAALCEHLADIGAVRRIEAVRHGPMPPRAQPGGVVLDLAVHDLDLIARLAAAPLEVVAVEHSRDPASPEAPVRAHLAWATGEAQVEATWKPLRRRSLRVVGTSGVLEADFLAPSLTRLDARGAWRQKLSWFDPLETEHAAFRMACEGRFDAVADLAPQIESLRLAEAILRG